MRELTQEPFQVREIIRRKVVNNCHVLSNGYYYSVPYEYVEENVILKVSGTDIIICNIRNEKIAEHNLGSDERKRYITNPFHLPSQHQVYQEMAECQAEDYLKKAGMIGPKTWRFCELILQRSAYPEQEYRTVSGVIHFCDNKPREITERAADCGLNHGKIGLNNFKKSYELP